MPFPIVQDSDDSGTLLCHARNELLDAAWTVVQQRTKRGARPAVSRASLTCMPRLTLLGMLMQKVILTHGMKVHMCLCRSLPMRSCASAMALLPSIQASWHNTHTSSRCATCFL